MLRFQHGRGTTMARRVTWSGGGEIVLLTHRAAFFYSATGKRNRTVIPCRDTNPRIAGYFKNIEAFVADRFFLIATSNLAQSTILLTSDRVGRELGRVALPILVAPDAAAIADSGALAALAWDGDGGRTEIAVMDLRRGTTRPATIRVLARWHEMAMSFGQGAEHRFLLIHDTRRITIWDLRQNESVATMDRSSNPIVGALLSRDDNRLYLDTANFVECCSAADGRPIWNHAVSRRATAEYRDSMRLSPDGRLLAVARRSAIWILDAEIGAIRGVYDWSVGKIRSIAFSPDGLTIAALGRKGNVIIWDLD